MVLSKLTLPRFCREYTLTRCIRSTKTALSALIGVIDSFAPPTVGLLSSLKKFYLTIDQRSRTG